jgi:glycerol uptake facilitator-like aquaporin
MAEGAEFIMPLMIGFLVVGLVMALGGPTGKSHNGYKNRCTAVVLLVQKRVAWPLQVRSSMRSACVCEHYLGALC